MSRPPGLPPLFGRDAELARVLSALPATRDGRAAVVLIAGEPGIGKTRLLHEVALHAQAEGWLILRGGASDAEGMPPYLPLLEALGTYIQETPPSLLREETGAAAGILAGILPELVTRLGDLPQLAPLPPEQSRLRLYEAAGGFLAAISHRAPLVFLIDDLQWADAATCDLLCHVLRRHPVARLLLLGAYRDGEGERNPAFARFLAESARLRLLTSITLTPLDERAVGELAGELLGAPVAAVAARLLQTRSEGNPFFVEELARGWQESGLLVRAEGDGHWSLASPGPITSTTWSRAGGLLDMVLPPTVIGAVRRRLSRLAPEVVESLRLASVAGRTFDVALLAAVADGDPEVIEEHLQEAVRARLLQGDGAGVFTFRHDRVRECLYDELTSTRRARLHRAVGLCLEERHAGGESRRAADLAFHFIHGGDRARGAAYAAAAGREALAAWAPDDALGYFHTAVALCAPDSNDRGGLLELLGQAAVLAGHEREGADAFTAGRDWCVAADDRVGAARMSHARGQALWRLEEHEQARSAFMDAVRLAEQDENAAGLEANSARDRQMALVRALVDLSSLVGMSLGRLDEGLAHGRRALKIAETLGDPAITAAAMRAVGNLLMRGNSLAEGVPLLERALTLAEAAGDVAEAGECLAHLGIAMAWTGANDRLDGLLARWLQLARDSHDPYQLRHVYTLAGAVACNLGRWAEAVRRFDKAQQVIGQITSPEPAAFLDFMRGWLAWNQGDDAAAEAHLVNAIATFRSLGPSVLVWYLGALGVVQVFLGKRAEAAACIDELERLIALHPPGSMPTAEPLTYMAQMVVALEDRERAARLSARLRDFHGQYHDLSADRLLGELALLLGDLPAADAWLTTAELATRRARMRPELARTLAARAGLASIRGSAGDAAQAGELFNQALALFEELGMRGEIERLRRRRAALVPAPSVQRLSALPDGLSAREAEVLRLVAAGHTNQEIADALVLSVRTVERHIAHIYAKTGARGRADATRYAVLHQLMPPTDR